MFSRNQTKSAFMQEQSAKQAAQRAPHTLVKCQGIAVTLVMADPNDPFVLKMNEAIKAHLYQTRYGIHLKLADRAVAVSTDDKETDEDASYEEVEHDINYHAKIKKTKNAANGRQQTRREKNAELSNDIRKTTKKIAKVVVTKVCLSSVDNSAGEETTPIATKQTKPTKHELREKTQIRSNKRVYKTHQACSCICNKRNLAVHGCLCT